VQLKTPIPSTLMIECPDLVKAKDSTPQEIMNAHIENIRSYAICKSRYNNLIEAVKNRD
jgi:hypothetical protein